MAKQTAGRLSDIRSAEFALPDQWKLVCGKRLAKPVLTYECYGELSPRADNAVLVCHALSSSHHAAGWSEGQDPDKDKPGWWNELIGPGKAMDTDRFYVVCANNLGGCHGSTGPASVPPDKKEPYGAGFPAVVVEDWVRSQALLADHLGIACWHAVVGGSLGGMQALEWSLLFPDRLQKAVVIAAAASLSAQNIAFNTVARRAIAITDDHTDGMGLARMIGHVTYLSELGMHERFGRDTASTEGAQGSFEVERYLKHQAKQFVRSGFDVNTYLLMTRVLDEFDPALRAQGDLAGALSPAQCRFLLVSFDSDWRFPPERSREIVRALLQAGKSVSYLEVESDKGHDSFLFALEPYVKALRTFLTLPTTGVQS